MFINQICNQNFKARVPLSEYKGVILKLTDSDKSKIAQLMSEKSLLELQLTKIEERLDKKKIIESSGLISIYEKIQMQITKLDEQIKQVKIDRKNQQVAELKSIDLMM